MVKKTRIARVSPKFDQLVTKLNQQTGLPKTKVTDYIAEMWEVNQLDRDFLPGVKRRERRKRGGGLF